MSKTWQENLEDKYKTIKKEEHNDVSIGCSSNSRSGIRDNVSSERRQNINKDKKEEKKQMITRDAALDDLEKLEKEVKDEVSKVVIEVARILVKLLTTIRSNQLLTEEDKKKIREERAKRPQLPVKK